MPIRLIVAVTDKDWFDHLRRKPALDEVNFWSPSPSPFKALVEGELFLFKLHAPINMIVGGGVFAFANTMPLSLAWEAFGEANGAGSLPEMRQRILKYRQSSGLEKGPIEIGCRVLTQPFFLDESEWFPPPSSWTANTVRFKGYSTETTEGRLLWDTVVSRLGGKVSVSEFAESTARYGEPVTIFPRLGQGAFRLLVTQAYNRRCAITRERTLPALEAAHIRPYSDGGEHAGPNGLLLRRDLHSLFDAGYVTVTPDYRFEVSRRIREEFENGKDYYALHGAVVHTPDNKAMKPDIAALNWHNEVRFLG